MPITVGPGSIAVAITLGSQRPRAPLSEVALIGGTAVVGLLAITATIYVCYRFAKRTVAALGQHGTNVLCGCQRSFCSASASRLFGTATGLLSKILASRVATNLPRRTSGIPSVCVGATHFVIEENAAFDADVSFRIQNFAIRVTPPIRSSPPSALQRFSG